MLSRIWLINAILVLLVVFFGLKAYGVWSQENKGTEIPKMAQKPVQKFTKPVGTLYEGKIPPESEYDVLMALNLFSSERTEIIPEVTKPDEKTKQLSEVEQKNIQLNLKKLALYGLVITDDSAEALVTHLTAEPVLDRKTERSRTNTRRNKKSPTVKQTKWVKAGDTLGDFEVVAIKPDRVLLKAGGQSYDLLLYDKENIKSRGPAKPRTGPTVVGVSVKPPVTNVAGKKPTVPLTVKKETAARPLPFANQESGAGSPAMQKNPERDMKKKQAR